MKIFIDETGIFTPQSGWSAVCALSLPHREVGPAQRSLAFASRNWPRVDGELKGGVLWDEHLACLVELLFRHDAILHICAMDVAAEDQVRIAEHQQQQCEEITRYLAPTHHPKFVQDVRALRATLERMSQQLYIQSTLMSDLVCDVLGEVSIYFSQRRPKELGTFLWCVDAKDPLRETTQERWWRNALAPLLESRSRREPMRWVRGPEFNYAHFLKAFRIEKEMWFPDGPREQKVGFNIKAAISENVHFRTSHSEILLQAVDILASFARRLLNGRSTEEAARLLGRLQILHRREDGQLQNLRVMSFSREGMAGLEGDIRRQINIMASTGRSMVKPSARRRTACR